MKHAEGSGGSVGAWVLVFLVPQRRLAVSARNLAVRYTRLARYRADARPSGRFPDPECADAGQVVLLAVKREGAVARPVLSEVEGRDEQRTIEAWSAGRVLFASQFFDPETAAQQARQSGLWASPVLAERLWPAEERGCIG